MNERLQKYYEDKKKELEEIKFQNLIALGFYNKEYYDGSGDKLLFPNVDYDESGRENYYRITYDDISDQEYEEIMRLHRLTAVQEPNNKLAHLMYCLGGLFIILSFVLMPALSLLSAAIGIPVAIIFISLGVIITRIEYIKCNMPNRILVNDEEHEII